MSARLRRGTPRAQRGIALIILMIIAVLGVAWMLMSAIGEGLNTSATDRIANGKVLGEAKAALIGYVAKEAIDASEASPGRLPCPEAPGYVGTANEGIAAGSCTLPAVGRLPWRTLGLDKLVDASGSPLWYVVSPGWALPSTTSTVDINFNTQGQLSVDGQPNAAVALIIAPGPPLSVAASANCTAWNQTRSSTPLDVRDYLECQNASGGTSFVTSGPVGSFNDQLVKITASDIMNAISGAIAQRIQRDIVPVIAAAGNTMGGLRLPAPNPVPPIFPLAASWTNPTTSTYTGAANTFGGLLPLVRSRKSCTPGPSDPSCDPTLLSEPCVRGIDAQCDLGTATSWQTSGSVQSTSVNSSNTSATVTWSNGAQVIVAIAPDDPNGGRSQIGGVNCGLSTTPSTATNVICKINYGEKCTWYWFFGWYCPSIQPYVTITAVANNVGASFKQLNPGCLTSGYCGGTLSNPSYYGAGAGNAVTLSANGSATVTTEWQLPATYYGCNSTTCLQSTINIPSLYITDNVAFQSQLRDAPTSGSDLRWFLRDGWEQWLYYDASQGYAPGGPGACGGGNPSCLTVNLDGSASTTNAQALLVFSGPALIGKTQPSGQLTDYFEGQNATPGNSIFERHTRASNVFDDRVMVIAP